jgi:hypothetical protein
MFAYCRDKGLYNFQVYCGNNEFPQTAYYYLLFFRKVLREGASGGRDAERVKLKLEIVVEVIYHLYVLSIFL